MGLLDKAKELEKKAQEIAKKQGGSIKKGVAKAADIVEDKTGHKHDKQIEAGEQKAKDAIDRLAKE